MDHCSPVRADKHCRRWVGKVLANCQTVDDCQAEQGGKRFYGWAQGQGWGGKAGAECAAQERVNTPARIASKVSSR